MRVLDVVLASAGFVLALPFLLVAAGGIKAVSHGPVLYKARRLGRNGRPFDLCKLRTMHAAVGGSPITAHNDPRVFRFGSFLRKSKIDELPQLWNVIVGDMALVGPRPEDPAIVREYFTEVERRTLDVRPGLTSPGTLYYFALGESLIDDADPVGSYVGEVLRTKLALDVAYVDEASTLYDLALIGRTALMIVKRVMGVRLVPEPPELTRYQCRWANDMPVTGGANRGRM